MDCDVCRACVSCRVSLLHFTPNRYKSFKEAMLLCNKGNSLAGATAKQIMQNKTSLLVLQHKKCPCFDVFEKNFGHTPGVKPVHPKEGGGMAVSAIEDDLDDAPPPPVLATSDPSPLSGFLHVSHMQKQLLARPGLSRLVGASPQVAHMGS